MKKAAILGHFAFGEDKANGQTIKTKIVGAELKKHFGEDEVTFYDTMGGWKFLLKLPFVLIHILYKHKNVVLLPAYKAVCIIVPTITLLNVFFRRHLHYVVIGGRLTKLIHDFPLLKTPLRRLSQIYPETHLMQKELGEMHISNATIMPNFKHINIISEDSMPDFTDFPLPLVTFSRVERTKGIEDAINAVKVCNNKLGRAVYTLDIYGLIQKEEWFKQVMEKQPDEIRYCGLVPFDKSTETLSKYFALLFPTYYAGEGFAGTIIDAMAAGLPVVASNWKANPEIVKEGETGFLFPVHSVEAMADILIRLAEKPEATKELRLNCIKEARKYQPDNAIQPLFRHLA